LFWGIRGGGSNFGVCTEFVLRLHPQRRTVFAGIVIFPAAMLDDLMKVLIQWWATVKDHEGMLQILGRDRAGNVGDGYLVHESTEHLIMPLQDCVILQLFYNGSEEEGRENFKIFYDLSERRCGDILLLVTDLCN